MSPALVSRRTDMLGVYASAVRCKATNAMQDLYPLENDNQQVLFRPYSALFRSESHVRQVTTRRQRIVGAGS